MRWRRFRLWLHGFNPVAIWRTEREKDRQAQILIAEEIGSAIRSQSEVATKAIDLAHQFVKNMVVPDDAETRSWVVRDEDEFKDYMERSGTTQEDFLQDQ